MAQIKPIRALRYTAKAGDMAKNVCPPYDIINAAQRQALCEKSPYNLIRLELPEGEDRYHDASTLLKQWVNDGILACDDSEGIFIYEEAFSVKGTDYIFDGLVCLCKTYDFSEKVVLPHEETLSKAKEDRFNLMKTTFCNFSSIYSLYVDEEKVTRAVIASHKKTTPLVAFTDDEGVTHRLWKIEDRASLDTLITFFAPRQLFIADGHHRYETAGRFDRYCRENAIAGADSGFVLMTLVDMDDPGLVIFPTHRLIVDMKIDVDAMLSKIAPYFEVTAYSDLSRMEEVLSAQADKHAYAFYDGKGGFRLLVSKDSARMVASQHSEAYNKLDVTVLHTLILEQALGIDRENMANQVNLRYTRSIDEAIAAVDAGKASAAFIINPTRIGEIKNVALAGDKMPQKSTYFYPKLITGLVMNRIKEI